MRCKTCEYPLWTIRSRICPECGSGFLPSEYEFNLNSVRFCCPHCDQQYFGTAANGHLEPREFACVRCKKRVDMDEMVLLPREGVAEKLTETQKLPWTDRNRRWFFSKWFGTLGLSMGAPGRLMRMVPEESSVGRALWFAFVNMNVAALLSIGVMIGFFVIMAMGGGGGMGGGVFPTRLVMYLLVWFGGSFLFPIVWAGVSHVIASPGSAKGAAFDRTLQAVCYSSGAMVITAIPCMGFYVLPVALLWWTISATIMLGEAHGISGGRAFLSACVPPVLAIGGLIAWFVISIISPVMGAGAWAGGGWTGMDQTNATGVASVISAEAMRRGGAYPTSGAELLASSTVSPFEMYSVANFGSQGSSSYNGVAMWRYSTDASAVENAIAFLPEDVVAHRVGDWVFTWHGFTALTDGDLWVAVMAPPAGSPADTRGVSWWAVEVDGDVTEITPAGRGGDLTAQNSLRERYGLEGLYGLELVTEGSPVVP